MRFSAFLQIASVLILPASALNIILNNDDSWGTANIRALYKALKDAGHDVLIVAPVRNQSGKGGSISLPLSTNISTAGDFDLVKPGSPNWGTDENDENIWYFEGSPATCTLFALDYVVPKVWKDKQVDLVVSGPNEGNNLGSYAYTGSGTFGGAYNAIQRGIPGIAVSAFDLAHRSYKQINSTADPAILTANATAKLIQNMAFKAGLKRLLPYGYGINVNFPQMNSSCSAPDYTLARLSLYQNLGRVIVNETIGMASFGFINKPEMNVCITGDCSLPIDVDVLTRCSTAVTVFTIDATAPNGTTTDEIVKLLNVPHTNTTSSTPGSTTTPSSVKDAAIGNQPGLWSVMALLGAVSLLL